FDVMLEDASISEAQAVQEDLEAIDSIERVAFNSQSETYYKDSSALLQITVAGDNYSTTAVDAIEATTVYLDGEDLTYHLGGPAYSNYSMQTSVTQEIPIILLMAVLITLSLLILNARSWVEPLLFFVVIAMAIAMNLGSNLLYGEISYVTQSVAAVLQLGLSMNYSIILINRFYQEKASLEPARLTMKRALHKAFKPISSSSLTTVAGMLALSFMTFEIGMDLGLVLAKGILISLLSVMIILPGLFVLATPVIEKTKKRPFRPSASLLKPFTLKGRGFIPLLTLILFILAVLIHSTNTYTFADTPDLKGENTIEDTFGKRETVVLMVEKDGDSLDNEKAFLNALDEQEDSPLKHSQALSNTVYQPLTPESITDMGEADPLMGEILFTLYQMDHNPLGDEKIEMKTLITFLYDSVQSGDYDQFFTESLSETIVESYQIMEYLDWPQNDDYTYQEFAETSEQISEDEAKLAYAFYHNEATTIAHDPVPAITLIDYTLGLIETNEMVDETMDDSMETALKDAEASLENTRTMFESEEARRIVLTLGLDEEGRHPFDYVETLTTTADTHFEEDVYLTGALLTNYDLADTFNEDLLKISLVTISAIVILVAITFKAAVLPFILVIIIQGAIWTSMSVNALMDSPLHFMGYIVVSAIQMGATVDYGILIASNYLENRSDHPKDTAIKNALDQSISTVFTSALILITAGLAVGIFSSQKVIYTMGNLIARGAFVSALFVLFLLPGVLHFFDTILMKTTHRTHK
ncbi:MAG: efflux RND transporter permease subunit, partial [Bacillota bacterium]